MLKEAKLIAFSILLASGIIAATIAGYPIMAGVMLAIGLYFVW